jgi:AraC-like DNA-binding protein/GNAT superfamily N-acetyltransferase
VTAVYNKIVQYIDEHIKDEITITNIAEMTGYSANHIYKIFKVYSPYPIMDYIRRKKLYSAASEMYTGRNLYDIALDYGYETPAGFYKAFKTIFGCSPSEYKNNKKKEGIAMFIDNVNNIEELNDVLTFTKALYPNITFDFGGSGNHKYSRNFWVEQWKKLPELLLLAKENGHICGVALGWVDGDSITVGGDGTTREFYGKGIHEALFVEMEKRAKNLGLKGIALGIDDGLEEFYAKLGYIGKTLIQSEKYSVDELKAFNEERDKYEVIGSSVYEGYVNQLWLNSSLLDKHLKKRYEEEIGDCWVQIIVSKNL